MISTEVKAALDLLRSGSLHDMDTDIEDTNDAAALVLSDLESAHKEIARLQPYEAAIRAAHNGYDPEMRKAMTDLKEPATPADALRELNEDKDAIHEMALQFLASRVKDLQPHANRYAWLRVQATATWHDITRRAVPALERDAAIDEMIKKESCTDER